MIKIIEPALSLDYFGCIPNCRIPKLFKFGEPNQIFMTKEEFLAISAKRYDELKALNKIDNFYDYEKEFSNIIQELGKEILEKNLSELPADRRKKKPSQNLDTPK